MALDNGRPAAAGPPARRLRGPRPDRPRPARPGHPAGLRRRAGPAVRAPPGRRRRGAPPGAGRGRPARRHRAGHPDDDLRPAHRPTPTSTAGASAGGCSTSSPRRRGDRCSRPSGCPARSTAWSPASWPPTWRPSSARRSATPPATPAARHVTVTLDVADEVVVEVVDDGRGIDEQRRPQRAAQPRGAGRAGAAAEPPSRRCPTAAPGCAGRAPPALTRGQLRRRGRRAGPRSSVASTAACVRRSRPSLASRWET